MFCARMQHFKNLCKAGSGPSMKICRGLRKHSCVLSDMGACPTILKEVLNFCRACRPSWIWKGHPGESDKGVLQVN